MPPISVRVLCPAPESAWSEVTGAGGFAALGLCLRVAGQIRALPRINGVGGASVRAEPQAMANPADPSCAVPQRFARLCVYWLPLTGV